MGEERSPTESRTDLLSGTEATYCGWRVQHVLADNQDDAPLVMSPPQPVPLPGPTEVLVRVMSAAIAPHDVMRATRFFFDASHSKSGGKWLPRLWSKRAVPRPRASVCVEDEGVAHSKHRTKCFGYFGGTDGAGVVQAVGSHVLDLQPGDPVQFHVNAATTCASPKCACRAGPSKESGSWSGYVVAHRHAVIALSPNYYRKEADSHKIPIAAFEEGKVPVINLAEAAALPHPAWTAYVALFDKLRVKSGERLLVMDCWFLSAVGFIAAQLAHHFGVRVVVAIDSGCITCNKEGGCRTSSSALSPAEQQSGDEDEHLRYLRQCGIPCISVDVFAQQETKGARCAKLLEEVDHVLFCSDFPSEDVSKESRAAKENGFPSFLSVADFVHCTLRRDGCVCFATPSPPPSGFVAALLAPHPDISLAQRHVSNEKKKYSSMEVSSPYPYSVHYVHVDGLRGSPATRSLIRELGEAVYRLYLEGVFRLFLENPCARIMVAPVEHAKDVLHAQMNLLDSHSPCSDRRPPMVCVLNFATTSLVHPSTPLSDTNEAR